MYCSNTIAVINKLLISKAKNKYNTQIIENIHLIQHQVPDKNRRSVLVRLQEFHQNAFAKHDSMIVQSKELGKPHKEPFVQTGCVFVRCHILLDVAWHVRLTSVPHDFRDSQPETLPVAWIRLILKWKHSMWYFARVDDKTNVESSF